MYLKCDTQGNVTGYRAHLVAKGFLQTTSVDYKETFAPVARLGSLRLLLLLTATFYMEAHHIDIKSAYFNGNLDEEIYMDQPKDFTVPGQESKVCCLQKALYNLKQAGWQWHAHLHSTLEGLGFKKNISSDVSIFIKRHDGGDLLIILVYIDNIALFGALDDIQAFKMQIAMHYKITDLGEVNQFLELHITHDRLKKTLTVDHSHYIQKMLTCFDMSQCSPVYTSFAAGMKLEANLDKDSNSSLTSGY